MRKIKSVIAKLKSETSNLEEEVNFHSNNYSFMGLSLTELTKKLGTGTLSQEEETWIKGLSV